MICNTNIYNSLYLIQLYKLQINFYIRYQLQLILFFESLEIQEAIKNREKKYDRKSY
jgi:hypothetical protein